MSSDALDDATVPTAPDGRALSPRGQRTRMRLLDAAEAVFTDLGYHDASIVKITEAAGVAQGTFYLYFASKQDAFEQLVADLNRRVRHAMSEGAARGTSRVERELGGFEGFFRFTAEHPGLYRIIRQAEFVSPGALQHHYDRIAEGYVEGLRAAMDAGEITEADPEVIAWMLMGVGEIIGMRWILWGGADAVPAAVLAEMSRFITSGLTGPGTETA